MHANFDGDAIKTKRVRKKNNTSRKKKKDWRKNIDLTELEDALEKDRLELRTGGIVSNKANNELFVVEKSLEEAQNSSVNAKRDHRYLVDRIIVPDPSLIKLPRVHNKKDRMRQKIQESKLFSKLQRQLLRRVLNKPNITKEEITDIWEKNLDEVKQDLFKKNVIVQYTEQLRKQTPKRRPLHKQSPFNKNAVEVAHPGTSYNPTFEDHQELLAKEHDKEMKRIIKKESLQKALAVKRNEVATPEIIANELIEGLGFQETESTDEQDEVVDNEDHAEEQTINLEFTKPKSKKQRKHEARLERRKHIKDFVIKREKQYQQVKKIISEFDQAKKEQDVKKARRAAKVRRPMLSRIRYEEPDQEFKLSSEIQGSLRKLKPEGSVMFDRYMSMQKRCIIEPRKKFKTRRRNKAVLVEKRSFREITL